VQYDVNWTLVALGWLLIAAEMTRRLEVLRNTLGQTTKYCIPSNSSLVGVLGSMPPRQSRRPITIDLCAARK
jgi:hypothetical protein